MLPKPNSGLSTAGVDLGLGDLLNQQVASETEETRKKRMLQQQQVQQGAASMLLGVGGGIGV